MARPAVFNAFDEQMIGELDAAFAALAANRDVRLVVLSAQGKHFSAGADLQWMQRASQASEADNLADARRFAAMLSRLAQMPQPTLARVQGAALGGGVGLVCACDLAIASEDARFALSEARLGILPAVIGPYLVNAVGLRQAKALALMAERIDAQRALAIGLVQQVVPAINLDAAVDVALQALLQGSPQAQCAIKEFFGQLSVGPVGEAARELSAQTISRARTTDDAREGFAAFLHKRPPRWAVS
jgi:methylglutaconyl-CoA hydratase